MNATVNNGGSSRFGCLISHSLFCLKHLLCSPDKEASLQDQYFSKWSVPPPGGVEEMQGGGRRVRLEWGAYITV
ncbi:hypothetical protein FHG87_000999 [Trinorchestia longiramus]|nr:hypothetical protein FHG87_000999 [Trinorchestia longiramus]